MSKVLVTGATGNVVSLLIPLLKKEGADVRALIHSESKAQGLKDQGVEVHVGEYEDPATLDAAFDGVDAAFLVAPPHEKAAGWMTNLIAAAKKAGTAHVVRLSAIKADKGGPTDNTQQHGATDEELQATGLSYTILRPHFFMQNLFMGASTIGSEGVFYMGMGDGKMGMVDVRDIADVACQTLLHPDKHKNKIYTLTGPKSISFHEVAKAIGDELGKEVKYQPVPVEAVVSSIKDMGMGDWFAKIMGQYSKAYAEGWGDLTTDDVKTVAGNASRSIETFAKEVLVPAIKQG